MPGPRTIAPLVLLLCLAGCKRGTVDPGFQFDSGPGVKDGRILIVKDSGKRDGKGKTDGWPMADFLQKVDLPVTVGHACHYGQCGTNLICMANICEKQCTEPQPGCNAKTSECAANKTCIWASTFSGACLESTAKYLQPCQGKICEQGTLCVTVGSSAAKCLRLCQYGCPAGVPCGKTNNGCSICVQ